MQVFLILVCLILSNTVALAGDVLSGPVPARVLRVIDGDTLEVRARVWLGQEIVTRVRLAGIDTPELRGRCTAEKEQARQARAALQQMIQSGQVRLRNIRYGKFAGRVLADLETDDGQDPQQILLRKGLARPYDGATRTSWCP